MHNTDINTPGQDSEADSLILEADDSLRNNLKVQVIWLDRNGFCPYVGSSAMIGGIKYLIFYLQTCCAWLIIS